MNAHLQNHSTHFFFCFFFLAIQHIPLGMVFAVNVLPSKQLPIPKEVPTEGPCPVWSSNTDEMTIKKENDMLKQKVVDLQKKLVKETDAATKCLNDEQQQEHLFH